MRTFDHADVVGAVSDGERDALAMSFDEVDDERLLQRRDATADDRLTASGRVQQQQLHLVTQRVHLPSLPRQRARINAPLKAQFSTVSRKFFTSLFQPSSCLHILLPTPRDPVITTRLRSANKFPRLPSRTRKYQTFISYALAHYQTS